MQALELAKYLGIGYQELASSPRWFVEMALIRLQEESEYNAYLSKKNSKQ